MTTRIADIIIPEVWHPYSLEQTAQLSAFVKSGVAVRSAEFDAIANSASKTVELPFFKDLTFTGRQIRSDVTPLSVKKIGTSKDTAVIHRIGEAWGANDLSAELSGADPAAAIASRVGSYYSRVYQHMLLKSLDGVFSSLSMAGLQLDVTNMEGTRKLDAAVVVDAGALLGDARGKFAAIALHSAVAANLAKQNLIEYLPDSEGRPVIKTYLGYHVIEDDSLPVTNDFGVKQYASYLFAPGAVGYGEGSPRVPVETDRDSLQGDDFLITRRDVVFHPRGVSYVGVPTGVSPADVELTNGANWNRVWEAKNVGIVKILTNG